MPMMRCELKDHEADDLALLPIRQSDGSLNTMACLEHARETEFFCQAHDHPHLGFEDGTHACTRCIEERVATAGIDVGRHFLHQLRDKLPGSEFSMILEYAAEVRDHPAMTVLRWITTVAERLGVENEDVVRETISAQSVDLILPMLQRGINEN